MSDPWLKTFCHNVEKVCVDIPDDSVDVIVTSPPYKVKDGYSHHLMEGLGATAGRVLKPGGLFFLNFGQLKENFARPWDVQQTVWDLGNGDLQPRQTIIWVKSIAVPTWRHLLAAELKRLRADMATRSMHKYAEFISKAFSRMRKIVKGPGETIARGHVQPINSNKILNYCWEPIFVFAKPPVPDYDRLSIGVNFADKSNLKRGDRGKNGDLRCGGDAWFVPHKTTGKTQKKDHKDEFPAELVSRCLKLANLKLGATVYEPFLGGGTTAVVAKEMGLNVYATDICAETIKTATERWGRV